MSLSFFHYSAAVIAASVAMCMGNDGQILVTAATDDNNHVRLEITAPRECTSEKCTIYRSHADINHMIVLDMNYMPITKNSVLLKQGHGLFIDSMLACNCTYYYYVKITDTDERTFSSAVKQVALPDAFLPPNEKQKPSLFIDKINYFLELRYNSIPVKRYPVALGGLPQNRKLCYDQRSTPEGIYKIEYRRPKASFYKAFGVSYPNATDYQRYHQAIATKKIVAIDGAVPSIGGSIQIHGCGVENNWTWGCIAMRNEDIDELFSVTALTTGSPVYIVGKEVTRESIALQRPDNL